MGGKVVVVVFIHKVNPTDLELISFNQVFRILHKHKIVVVCPQDLDTANYEFGIREIEFLRIPNHWQSSILSYNKLKLSNYFYRLFNGYEYLLTYELDAFVFKDELLFWCDQGYDYIGAPWFKGFSEPKSPYEFLGVGNSGFSLRKISAMFEIINGRYSVNMFLSKCIWNKYGRDFADSKITNFFNRENRDIQRCDELLEDIFIHNHAVSARFCVPVPELALKFSFEVNPTMLFSINNKELPFGCHAWWKYEPNFWFPLIRSFNYLL
jgi:hypothetical protein